MVKFAQEKLDSRYAKDRTFDKLPFNLLVAGEIEIIMRPGIHESERRARLAILRTIAYHKNYLQDEDLRDGYDVMMKKVEHGYQQWDEVLGEHLHKFLNFRVNLQARERAQATENNRPFTKVETKRSGDRRNDYKDKVIYCQDYNNNRCPHLDHHEGKFAGNKVTKWHICKKCAEKGENRSHRWTDKECPLKST